MIAFLPAVTLASCGVFVLSAVTVRLARSLAPIDKPNSRSSHAIPTPRGGGAAIAFWTLVGLIFLNAVFPIGRWRAVTGFALAASLIAITGFVDDLKSLSPFPRFIAQIVGACIVIIFCGSFRSILCCGWTVTFSWLALPLTAIWIVGLTNAYNFMDGIDGIAGSQAVISGLGCFALGLMAGEPLIVIIGAILAAASLGFLVYNWPPATIFMGDVGSAFIGFVLASIPLLSRAALSRLLIPSALLVWPFLFDTLFTFTRRVIRRENVFSAHRSHLYQRLVATGYSHAQVATLFGIGALAGGCGAVLFLEGSAIAQLLVISFCSMCCACLWVLVSVREQAWRKNDHGDGR